jgi:hypothetical protein
MVTDRFLQAMEPAHIPILKLIPIFGKLNIPIRICG